MSNLYHDNLDELEDQLQKTHIAADEVLSTLEKLLRSIETESSNDATLTADISQLKTQNDELLKKITFSRVLQIQSSENRVHLMRDPQLSNSKLFLSPEDRDDPSNLFNYFEETKLLHEAWLRHLSLLSNLSDELVVKFEGLEDANKVIINRNSVPPELEGTLHNYEEVRDNQQHIEDLRSQLFQYLDEIKAGRAKYALENKYILNKSLQEISKEVSEWSQRWTSLENSLFGDSPTSLKRLIQKAEDIRELLSSETAEC